MDKEAVRKAIKEVCDSFEGAEGPKWELESDITHEIREKLTALGVSRSNPLLVQIDQDGIIHVQFGYFTRWN